MQTCYTCKAEKPLSEYNRQRQNKSGLTGSCRQCLVEYRKRWRSRNPHKVSKSFYKSKYGITLEQRSAMVTAQACRCSICGETFEEFELQVDHNHSTNEVRGMLCGPCNRMLGQGRDDIARLEAAISYLKNDGDDRAKAVLR